MTTRNTRRNTSVPKLSQHQAALDRIEEQGIYAWPRLFDPRQAMPEIIRHLGQYPSDLVEEALQRHIEDTSPTSRGEPAGHYPPSIAQLKAWTERIEIEKRRAAQDRINRQREEEERSVHAGRRVLQKLNWKALLHGYTVQRNAINRALKTRLYLDWANSDHCRVLQHVTKAWADRGLPAQLEDDAMNELLDWAVEQGQTFIDEQRALIATEEAA